MFCARVRAGCPDRAKSDPRATGRGVSPKPGRGASSLLHPVPLDWEKNQKKSRGPRGDRGWHSTVGSEALLVLHEHEAADIEAAVVGEARVGLVERGRRVVVEHVVGAH